MAAGLIDRAAANRAQSDWDHDGNPIDPTSCYFCGYTIGALRRVQGHIYCSEECYLAHHVHQSSEPNTGRRDALLATGVMGVAGAMLLLDRRSGPAPPPNPNSRPFSLDLRRFLPAEPHDVGLSFKTEEGLRLWLAAREAWQSAGDAMRPLSSVLYAGIREFRAGMMEITSRGGAGMMVNATPDLSSYHFVAFRPIQLGGRVIDYTLDYGTRVNTRTVATSSRRLRLPAADVSRPDATFRLVKKGYNLEAYLELEPGNRKWLNKWEEKSLADGRLGLYVGEGLRYAVVAGRIQAEDAI